MTKPEFVHFAKSLRAELVDMARRRNVSDPDALVQDVFLSSAAKRGYIDVKADDARAYFFSAVHNRCLSAYRVTAGRATVAPMSGLDDVAETAGYDPTEKLQGRGKS